MTPNSTVIVVVLGNPGKKYQNTRHNAGFMLVEKLIPTGHWQTNKKAKALVAKMQFKDQTAILLKPQDYMNHSGFSVSYIVRQHQFPLDHLYVAHDDLDIQLGQFKMQFAKSPRDHKGLQSIYHHLKTDQFWHLRLGVDHRSPDHRIPGEDYVLNNFTPQETAIFNPVLEQAVEALLQHLISQSH